MQNTFGLTGRHCSVAGKFKFPEELTGDASDEYAFGYWLEITDSVTPAPGKTIAQTKDGNFYTAFHVANGPNIKWTAAVANTIALEHNRWHYVTGSFLSGRRGLTPQLTACTDNVCMTEDLRFHSNDVLGYAPETQMHVGAVGGQHNTEFVSPIVGEMDELLIKPIYDSPKTIVSRYETRYAAYDIDAVVFVSIPDAAAYYDPATEISLSADVSPTQLPNEVFTWVFTSPVTMVLTDAMTTTGRNKRTLSLKANVLTAGVIYVVRVCAIEANTCSGEVSFIAVAAPSITSISVACAQDCGADNVHKAQVSQFDVQTNGLPAAIPGISDAILRADLVYTYETEDPISQDPIPLTAGFAANQEIMTQVVLPAGSAPDYELTVRVLVKQLTTGFVTTASTTVRVQPDGDSQPVSDQRLTNAVEGGASPAEQVVAVAGVADVQAAVGGRYARALSSTHSVQYLLTILNKATMEILASTNNAADSVTPTILQTLQNLLVKLNTDILGQAAPNADYLTNATALLASSTEMMNAVLKTQVQYHHLNYRFERYVIACVNVMNSITSTLDTLTTNVVEFDAFATNIALDAIRKEFLHQVVLHRAAFRVEYSLTGLLENGATYAGLTPMDADNGYPQKTTLNVTTAFTGAATRQALVSGVNLETAVPTIGGGYVEMTTPPQRFSAGVKEAAATFVVTPNHFESRADVTSARAATDAVLVTMYEKSNTTQLLEVVTSTEGTANVQVNLLCASCLASASDAFYCAYITSADLASSTGKWQRLPYTVGDGIITCKSGSHFDAYYAAFRDTSVTIDGTPVPPIAPSTTAPGMTTRTFEMHVSRSFSSFSAEWFVNGFASAIEGLSRGDMKVLISCLSEGGVAKCVTSSRNAGVLADIADGTFVRFSLTLLPAKMDEVVARILALVENCDANNALGAQGLCPIPGTTLTEVETDTPVPTVAETDSDDKEWLVLGLALGLGGFVLCVLIIAVFYCSKAKKCCFDDGSHPTNDNKISDTEPISDDPNAYPNSPNSPSTSVEMSPVARNDI